MGGMRMAFLHHGGFGKGQGGPQGCPMCHAMAWFARGHRGMGPGMMMSHHGRAGHGEEDAEKCPMCDREEQGPPPMFSKRFGRGRGFGFQGKMLSEKPREGGRLERVVQHLERMHGRHAGGPPPQGQPPRRLRDAEEDDKSVAIDELRMQLRELQEQQAQMMKSLEALSSAIERSQQR